MRAEPLCNTRPKSACNRGRNIRDAVQPAPVVLIHGAVELQTASANGIHRVFCLDADIPHFLLLHLCPSHCVDVCVCDMFIVLNGIARKSLHRNDRIKQAIINACVERFSSGRPCQTIEMCKTSGTQKHVQL